MVTALIFLLLKIFIGIVSLLDTRHRGYRTGGAHTVTASPLTLGALDT